ncbi:MAG: hypothetical protein GXO15_02685 [Crenarchaeota archaeon]|nr:hypothetical protein [Thermoproteota archaeon]
MSVTATAKRKDFLRHIVNRVLASPDAPKQIVDDIRRLVGRAEDKYKFHAFGGDVRRLADYIRSREFEDLIMVAKSDRSGKGVEILRRILEEAKKAYSDIPEVVQAIEERLKQLEAGEAEVGEARGKPLEKVREALGELSKLGVALDYDEKSEALKLRFKDKVEAVIRYDEKNRVYMIDLRARDTRDFERIDALREYLRTVVEVFK